eukprot:TRINITY_DN16945_c0_g1_i1.p1 TRINITY_DN16945_c0_g1~~TRINITY_DN16945_c0_g1_i1.p1  ORF type:complete len:1124 (+),score=371.55 TRINITY_DN16945_c0_g1_i1:132-3503(+)
MASLARGRPQAMQPDVIKSRPSIGAAGSSVANSLLSPKLLAKSGVEPLSPGAPMRRRHSIGSLQAAPGLLAAPPAAGGVLQRTKTVPAEPSALNEAPGLAAATSSGPAARRRQSVADAFAADFLKQKEAVATTSKDFADVEHLVSPKLHRRCPRASTDFAPTRSDADNLVSPKLPRRSSHAGADVKAQGSIGRSIIFGNGADILSPGGPSKKLPQQTTMSSFWKQQIAQQVKHSPSLEMQLAQPEEWTRPFSPTCASLNSGLGEKKPAADGQPRFGRESSSASTACGRAQDEESSQQSQNSQESLVSGPQQRVDSDEITPKRKVSAEQKAFGKREAFRRFRSHDTGDLHMDDIGKALTLMGHLPCNDEDLLEKMVREVCEFELLGTAQFDEFLEKYTEWEDEFLKADFEKKTGGSVELDDLPTLLREMGLMVATKDLVEDLVELMNLQGLQEGLDWEGFRRFHTNLKANAGFTREEVADIYEAFLEARDEDISSEMVPMIKVADCQLMSAVLDLDMFGLWAADHATKLFDTIPEETPESQFPDDPVRFGEFLRWAARLRDAIMNEFWSVFEESSGINDKLEAEELPSVMQTLGYSLLPNSIEEFTEAAEVSTPMDFEGLVNFAKTCYEADGFREDEQEEFKAVFERFDYQQAGEMDAVGVIDMIHFLGHHTGGDRAKQLIKKVDFNGNGSMDVGEFLRLMRLHREEEMMKIRAVFGKFREGHGEMHIDWLVSAIEEQQETPSPKFIREIVEELGSPEYITLETFVDISDKYRRVAVEKQRKNAGFTDPECQAILEAFESRASSTDKKSHKSLLVPNLPNRSPGESPSPSPSMSPRPGLNTGTGNKFLMNSTGRMDLAGLIWLLGEMRIPTNTKKARDNILNLIQVARDAAGEAGVEPGDVGGGENTIAFFDVLHLLRQVVRQNERAALEREEKVVEETKFTPSEVDEFRKIFRDWCRRSHDQKLMDMGIEIDLGDGEVKAGELGKHAWKRARMAIKRFNARRASVGANLGADDPGGAEGLAKKLLHMNKPELDCIISSRSLRCPLQSVQMLLASIGVRLSEKQQKVLYQKATMPKEDDDPRRYQEPPSEENVMLDFPDFLRVLRWMLDENVANINKEKSSGGR